MYNILTDMHYLFLYTYVCVCMYVCMYISVNLYFMYNSSDKNFTKISFKIEKNVLEVYVDINVFFEQ